MRTLVTILASVAAVAVCPARIITVDDDGPADFDNIQAAIDDANDGDTVLVADGTYTGPGNRDIHFLGKAIAVRSTDPNDPGVVPATVIDCQYAGRGFIFDSGEEPNSVLDGFTITHGRSSEGGAIHCYKSSPTITNCVMTANRARFDVYCDPLEGICIYTGGTGGAVSSVLSSPLIIGCVISNNIADCDGGAIECYSGGDPMKTPILRNCIIARNNADRYGDGLYGPMGKISNCTIVYNGRYGLRYCGNQIRDCIIWGNGDDLSKYSTATYSCIEDGDLGEGNISADPSFADANNGDYHLKSQAGRWDANEGRWTIDDVTSPCIDAGDPASPIGLEPFPNGGKINMGAYGGTIEASKSYFGKPACETIIAGDVNGDCIVDFKDMSITLLHWLEER